ncbi:MAG TPA: GDP-mannose 4,6-dehydratase [Nitrospirales bacterium]|nr:GDP-mannose 4,6-dehydratase [Nitrospirales bacterium]
MSAAAATLITGGAGFIGSHVIETLLARGERVVCLDNFDTFYDPAIKRANLAAAATHPTFTLVEGDLRDPSCLERVFSQHPITKVFHAAARAGVRPSVADPLLYEDVNVRGTVTLLEVARTRQLQAFVFASSSSVYGGMTEIPFVESAALNRPVSPYAATKLACEQLCYTYHHLYGLPITCLRFFTVYGPRQRPEMAIHRFVALVDQGQSLPVYGDGGARRDFTYIDDIVQGVVAALDRPFAFEIINLGESETTELRALIALIETAVGKPAKIDFRPPEPGDVPVTCADITKARRLLGYQPTTPVRVGLQRFVEWYRRRARTA